MNPKKATLSLRIFTDDWLDPHGFKELCELLNRFPGVADEISLFHSITHAPLRLEIVQKRAEVLKERMKVLRQMGYRTGVNILTTIGHHEENLPNAITPENYTPMTDITGGITRGSYCPNDPRVLDYVKELYRLITLAGPDYIWTDDDIRLWHWPNGMGCFCDGCLEIFKREYGKSFTRKTLKEAFSSGSREEKIKIRKAWLQHYRNMFANLHRVIETTVHALKPDTLLGQMTADHFWEGYDFDTRANILSGPQHLPVMWRPGGGCYREGNPWDIVLKSITVARQCSMLPSCVQSIQAEIERIPGNRFGKSAFLMALEPALFMAAGGTGAAFDSLRDLEEPFEECDPVFQRIKDSRPFYDLLVRTMGTSKPVGLVECWGKDTLVFANFDEGDWMEGGKWESLAPIEDFAKLGLPLTFTPENGVVTLLTGTSILLQPDNVEKVLSGGVYMDAAALTRLNELGYGELTGFQVERYIKEDAIEVFTSHPLNSGIENRKRDSRQSYLDFNQPAAVLKPTQPGAKALSRLIDYTPREIAPCSMGAYENQLGGRICVAGYYPWTLLYYPSKHRQLQNVMRWLSRDTLPAYIATFQRVPIWVRRTTTGGLAIALINAHFDPVENLVLKVRTEKDELQIYDMQCRITSVRAESETDLYKTFVLPSIAAWDMRLAVV
jgi:hypothetical protein